MRNSIKSLILSIIFLVFLFSNCEEATEKREIKLAHGLSEDHSVHKGMLHFATQLNEKSNGHLTVKIFPDGQMGSENDCIELLQSGGLGMTKVSAALMESFANNYKVLSVPYLFVDNDHRKNILDGPLGTELLNSSVEKGLKGLCFYDAGSRSFYTKDKPIRRPEELEGLRLRVMNSDIAAAMVEEFGAEPVRISWNKLNEALESGAIDGAENNPPAYYLSGHYKNCKYLTLDEHTSIPDVLLMGTILWNRLSEKEKEWITEAAKESVLIQRNLWNESVYKSLSNVREAGVKVIIPKVSLFREKTDGIVEEVIKDPEVKRLYNAIQENYESYK